MNPIAKKAATSVRTVLRTRGIDVVRHRPGLPPHIDSDAAEVINQASPYTMTAADSLFSLVESVRYVVHHGIPGAFVECGVWRGGSVMAVALTLLQLGVIDRDLYLYDTFEGMTAPTDADVLLHADQKAADMLAATELGDGANVWCASPLEQVQAAVSSTGYPSDRIHYVKGPVEETLPAHMPSGPVALLRLDTDWYESTRHEMEHLSPLLPDGGVLVIDDYWHWGGCRKAVDEYLERTGLQVLLTRVDITAVGTVHRS